MQIKKKKKRKKSQTSIKWRMGGLYRLGFIKGSSNFPWQIWYTWGYKNERYCLLYVVSFLFW